jgi:hypothetical protein
MDTVVKVDPLIRKTQFAIARGWSTRTVDRYVAARKIPRGEVMDGHGARGWRASLINMTLGELEQLAKAQAEAENAEVLSEHGRQLGAHYIRKRTRRAA